MGQKIHPLGFRLGITQKHRSQWFAKPNNYSFALQEDQMIRNYLTEELKDAGLSEVLFSRRADRIFIEVHVGQPKLVTGEGGARLKELTKAIQSKLVRLHESKAWVSNQTSLDQEKTLALQVVQVAQPATDARLLAQRVAQQLEKRVAFRRVMKQTIQQAREAGVEGIKVQIAGRLNGAEIARTEWAREGRVPLHTLRADIDYATYPAQTIYGILGIKIWIYKKS
jgi:small subunit ribosomal protein S3